MSSPSSPAAPQPSSTVSDLVPRLPNELWMRIFWYLDCHSLLNMARAVPQWRHLAFTPTVARNVTFGKETEERTIKSFLSLRRKKLPCDKKNEARLSNDVRKLHFTNCVALPSDTILHCSRSCRYVQELYCVNCVVEPFDVFRYLCELPGGHR
ncbi:hypothetical protein MTO96_003268 [Rhipicephalus appendiculatus]